VSGPLDLSLVEAGEYELVVQSWDELVRMTPVLDEQGFKVREVPEFRRHVKGDLVTLDVAEARRLLSAGAVLRPEDARRVRERAAERERARQVLADGAE
jgi:2-keto-3-deoxy-6-phosphogluconate aldolase